MFENLSLETLLTFLNQLETNTQPIWGTMSAQRMVEHLTDTVQIATGKNPQPLEIPEDRIPRMLEFLNSDKPMAQNIAVPFATPEMPLRNSELELAIDEFVEEWLTFEEYYSEQPDRTEIHPYYGPLNYEQWQRLSAKHFTHHFTQFGLKA